MVRLVLGTHTCVAGLSLYRQSCLHEGRYPKAAFSKATELSQAGIASRAQMLERTVTRQHSGPAIR